MSANSKPYLAQVSRRAHGIGTMGNYEVCVITGPGAAGKSALSVGLSEMTGLPVIELDRLFWRPGLTATPRHQWIGIQRELAAHESWIMDRARTL